MLLLVLFGVSAASGEYIEPSLRVPMLAGILAAVTMALSSLTLWFNKQARPWQLAGYASLMASIGVLVHATGGIQSPYVPLWMLAAVFAGLFGLRGVLGLALAANGYLGLQLFLGNSELGDQRLWLFALAVNLPIVVGYVLWGRAAAPGKDEKQMVDPQQAAQLVTNAGQADIVINSIADGVVSIDAQGTIQLINPAAQNLLGWPASDAKGLHHESVFKLLGKRDQALTPDQNPLEEVKITKQPLVNNDLALVSKDDKKMLVSLVVSPVLQDNQVAAVIVVFRDITAEKAREREQAEFVSTASHEMRTPVAAIEGYLALVANPKTANIDDKARMYLGKAQESVQHLGHLFKDLLTVSRAEDGRLEEHPQVTDIVGFVGSIAESLQPKAAEKDLELKFKPRVNTQTGDARSKLTPIYYANTDRDHLREVTANLIENAIKYTKQGKVTVDVTGDEKHIKISVEDTGIGVAEEDIPHLFQKFYRVDNSDTREVGGTGLGLSIARKLVEAMHGKLWVESVVGKGSIFYISLPRVSNTEIQNIQQTQAIEALQRKKSGAVAPRPPAAAPATNPAASTAAPIPASAPKPAPQPTVPKPPTPAPAPATYSAPQPPPTPTSAGMDTAAPKPTLAVAEPGPVPGMPEIRNPASSAPAKPPAPVAQPAPAAPVLSDVTPAKKPVPQPRRGNLTIPFRPISTRRP